MEKERRRNYMLRGFVDWFKKRYPGKKCRVFKGAHGYYLICEEGRLYHFSEYFDEVINRNHY